MRINNLQDHRYGLYPTDESAGISPAFVLKTSGKPLLSTLKKNIQMVL